MDTYQVAGLCIQGVIAIALLAGVVIVYRAIVRHEGAAASLQKTVDAILQSCTDIVAEIKGRLPAIERATGAGHLSLTEVLGQLRTLDKTAADALSELGKVADAVGQGNAQGGKLVEAVGRIGMMLEEEISKCVAAIERVSGDGLAATGKLAGEVAQLRRELIEATKF